MHANHKHKSAQQQLIGQRVRGTDAHTLFNLLTGERWLDTGQLMDDSFNFNWRALPLALRLSEGLGIGRWRETHVL